MKWSALTWIRPGVAILAGTVSVSALLVHWPIYEVLGVIRTRQKSSSHQTRPSLPAEVPFELPPPPQKLTASPVPQAPSTPSHETRLESRPAFSPTRATVARPVDSAGPYHHFSEPGDATFFVPQGSGSSGTGGPYSASIPMGHGTLGSATPGAYRATARVVAGDSPTRLTYPESNDVYGASERPQAMDVEVRLSGDELGRRGARDLGSALDLLPDVNLRQGGRGEIAVDIRGVRNRALLVRVDGMIVDEPWYGSFDVASIPITDIVEIRISKNSASPFDGPGGAGGIIDVITRRASGGAGVWARVQGAWPWQGWVSATGRATLASHHSVRASAGAMLGARNLQVTLQDGSTTQLTEDAQRVHGGIRTEHRFDFGTFHTQFWLQQRAFMVPPEDSRNAQVQHVDRQTSARFGVQGVIPWGRARIEPFVHGHLLEQRWLRYSDASLNNVLGRERLDTLRAGAGTRLMYDATSSLQLGAVAMANAEHASNMTLNGMTSDGGSVVLHSAAIATYSPLNQVRIEGSAGAVIPTHTESSAWPEAKVGVRYAPLRELEFRITAARKGRLPTLRERFEPQTGNATLDAEMSNFGEIQASFEPAPWLLLKAAGYARSIDGYIRFNDTGMQRENQDGAAIYGVDTRIDVARHERVRGGASWSHVHAGRRAKAIGLLDNMPSHRVDGWVEADILDGFGGWVRGRFIGDRNEGGRPVPSYLGLDVATWWEPHPAIRVSARVENVLNRAQYLRPNVRAPGTTFILTVDGSWD